MGQPRPYSRTKNFTADLGSETDHSALNAELDAAGNSINDIRTNIAILQADDGKLRPSVVTSDSISSELRASLVAGVTADTVALRDAAQASANSAASSATVATTQAGLATTNGAAQVALATTQAGLATTNGAAQVALATTQATNAATSATASASSATASANSATAAAGSATSAQASVASAGLPASIVGKALNWLRVKADELGYELRTATQARGDLGAAASGANSDITSLSLTTPLPVAQGGSGNATGSIQSTSPTVGIGYATGAGGAVTQLTNKQTAVTLNKICGRITMNNAAMSSGASTNFTLNNSTIAATDVVLACVGSGATAGVYQIGAGNVVAGTCEIYIRNNGISALSEAFVINFIVMKSVAA